MEVICKKEVKSKPHEVKYFYRTKFSLFSLATLLIFCVKINKFKIQNAKTYFGRIFVFLKRIREYVATNTETRIILWKLILRN